MQWFCWQTEGFFKEFVRFKYLKIVVEENKQNNWTRSWLGEPYELILLVIVVLISPYVGGVGVREGTFQSLCLEINFSSLLTKSPDWTNTFSSGLNFPQGLVGLQDSNIPRWQFTVLGVFKKPIMLLYYSNDQA